MEVITSIREDGKTQITVTIPAADVKGFIDAQYKEMSKARIPGFRPGKAPRAILDRNFGGHAAVFAQIAEDMVNEVAPKAVDSKDVLFVANPDFEELPELVEGQDYTFTLAGKAKPEVELLSYDPVEIEMPPAQATEMEIDVQIASLQSYYYDFETVEGAAGVDGEYVMISMACTSEGEPVQGMNSESRLVELGQGILPVAMEEQITGMKAEETKTFTFTVAEDEAGFEYLAGKEIEAEVTVKIVRTKVTPELNDEFAKKVGAEDMASLRTMLADAINKQKDEQLPALKERRCVEALGERVFGETPKEYLNFTRTDIARDFYSNLQSQGITLDQFLEQQGVTAEEFNADLEEEAKEVAAQSLALDALYKHLGLEITEEEIASEFEVVDNPAEVRKEWEDAGRMSEIREAIRRRKATEWLLETAVVTEQALETEEDAE